MKFKAVEVRGETHGDYDEVAIMAQQLKKLYRASAGWIAMTPAQQESFDLIATKQARILAGKADHAEHWHDIGGYAKLAEDRCK